MSACARLAIFLSLAIHLAVASAPCPTSGVPARARDHGALADGSARPCPDHATAEPTSWLAAPCPCGCGEGVPLGGVTARTGPALLLAAIDPLPARVRSEVPAAPLQLAKLALSPPEPVPLAIA